MRSMMEIPEHPEIAWALRTGYPSWLQERRDAAEEDDREQREEKP